MSRSKDLRTAEINHRRTHPVHLVLVNESIFTDKKRGKAIHPSVTTYIHRFHDPFQVSHGLQPVAPLTLLLSEIAHLWITFWILLQLRWWVGSGISWTICKSFAHWSRQTTMPVPHHSVFYRPDSLPATQRTVSKGLSFVAYQNLTGCVW